MTDEKFYELTKFERELAENGYKLIAGVDEAGRGPLAGPVVLLALFLRLKVLSRKLMIQRNFQKGPEKSFMMRLLIHV